MEESILKSTKKMLGIDESNTAFDFDIITQINSALSTLNQLGIGTGLPIEGSEAKWEVLALPPVRLNMVKTLIFLKAKLAFDPPGTSYLIDAMKDQIKEQEYRLNVYAESDRIIPEPEEVEVL